MNRRHFLKTLGLTIGALAFAPEVFFQVKKPKVWDLRQLLLEQQVDWSFAMGDKLTRKVWARKLWLETQAESSFAGFHSDHLLIIADEASNISVPICLV